jgi:hypothetical protein
MFRKYLLIIFLLIFIFFEFNSIQMSDNNKRILDEFKNQINYDEVLKKVDDKKSVVFNNIDPLDWDILKINKPTNKDIQFHYDGLKIKWFYDLGNDKNLFIEIFIDQQGHAAAMDCMLYPKLLRLSVFGNNFGYFPL